MSSDHKAMSYDQTACYTIRGDAQLDGNYDCRSERIHTQSAIRHRVLDQRGLALPIQRLEPNMRTMDTSVDDDPSTNLQ